ncbi:MAG: hypothetical protein J0L75_16980 [Spirochaetes bacterium]|nr:hypothetical protein [Spirochaetota bacterium]
MTTEGVLRLLDAGLLYALSILEGGLDARDFSVKALHYLALHDAPEPLRYPRFRLYGAGEGKPLEKGMGLGIGFDVLSVDGRIRLDRLVAFGEPLPDPDRGTEKEGDGTQPPVTAPGSPFMAAWAALRGRHAEIPDAPGKDAPGRHWEPLGGGFWWMEDRLSVGGMDLVLSDVLAWKQGQGRILSRFTHEPLRL